jgi:preprotein translocase subunit YajC
MNRRMIAVGGSAFVIAAAVGGGVAYANAGSSAGSLPAHLTTATSSSTTTKSTTPEKKIRPVLRRVAHGQITVRTKAGYRTVLIQRGQITADSGTKVTVKSGDSYTYTYTTDSNTKVRISKQKSAADKLATGDRVVVVSGTNGTALRISARTK